MHIYIYIYLLFFFAVSYDSAVGKRETS
jgi:hypothetical protein